MAGRLGVENERGSSFIASMGTVNEGHVKQVVMQAHQELLVLLQQRSELIKRIGTVKQTIAGLANLFGEGVLGEELLELVGDQKDKRRHPGFTNACRKALMEARCPMGARDVCDKIQEKAPSILAHHRDPMASVATVLNRLATYGEAEATLLNGRRAWMWVAEQRV
jgi:hypothetical protein